MQLISVVIPVFNEEQVLTVCYQRLHAVMQGLGDYRYELIFVNDGSCDKTLSMLGELAEGDCAVKVVSFSRNFGHQIAITAGMDASQGDAVVIIDADLQDPPELIPKMIELWQQGNQVVHAKRSRREGESAFKLITAAVFYRLLDMMTDISIPLDTGDFKLLDRSVVNVLKQVKERHRFVRGLVAWAGYKQCELDYQRDERLAGETKYPLRKMIKFAWDGITSFSIKPLKAATKLGFFAVLVSLVLVVYVFLSKMLSPETTVSGWASMLIAVVFLGGVQLLIAGITGEYIGRIYDETRNRPLYIIQEKMNLEEANPHDHDPA